jgi:hypothetical protein
MPAVLDLMVEEHDDARLGWGGYWRRHGETDGVWAERPSLVAAADYLQRRIHLITSEGLIEFRPVREEARGRAEVQPPIVIVLYIQGHFEHVEFRQQVCEPMS